MDYLVTTPQLWCNNISATYLTTNPMFHAQSKNLKIDFHFVHNKVVKWQLHACYISTIDQLAGIFTKPYLKLVFRISKASWLSKLLPVNLREDDKPYDQVFGVALSLKCESQVCYNKSKVCYNNFFFYINSSITQSQINEKQKYFTRITFCKCLN